jgi:SanA protein
MLVLLPSFSIFFADRRIKFGSKDFLYSDMEALPESKVALLLGTSKYLSNGLENLYYKYRIEAAVELYKARKIKYIVASGDNGRRNYDEPSQMRSDLVVGGVPESSIFLDFAGFRTLDSVIRMKEIFGQSNFLIISQRFHNERAVFLARGNGLSAIGFNARDVEWDFDFTMSVREKLARVKVFIDFFINKRPKFLGDKVEIGPECFSNPYVLP